MLKITRNDSRFQTIAKVAGAVLALSALSACGGGGGTTTSGTGTVGTPATPGVPGTGGSGSSSIAVQTITTNVDVVSAELRSGSPTESGLGASMTSRGTFSYVVENGAIVAARGEVAGKLFDIDLREGDTVTIENGIISATDAQSGVMVSFGDPRTDGFSYQNFGLWEESPDAGVLAAVSGGFRTPEFQVPVGVQARYTGTARGYSSVSGTVSPTQANLEILTNFRELDFMTTDTVLLGPDLTGINAPQLAPEHDMSGRLSVDGATFSGVVGSGPNEEQTVGPVTVNGAFYGPNAEEVGGTFFNDGELGQYYGAFGGKGAFGSDASAPR